MRDFTVWHDEMHESRHEHHHENAIRRAREERTRTPGRVLMVALLSLLVVYVTPILAFADTINAEVISGPTQVPILDMYGASIAAPDRYTAAALLMGYGPDAISAWSDDVKAKLSNAETGGNFYTFASGAIVNYFDATEHTGIFQDYFNFTGGTLWNIAQTLYGNNLWAALYTADELSLAKADLERVLSGENLGGGGEDTGEYVVFSGNVKYYNGSAAKSSNYFYSFGQGLCTTALKSVTDEIPALNNVVEVRIPRADLATYLEGIGISDYKLFLSFNNRSTDNNHTYNLANVTIYALPSDSEVITSTKDGTSALISYGPVIDNVVPPSGFNAFGTHNTASLSGVSFILVDNVITLSSGNYSISYGQTYSVASNVNINYFAQGSSGSGGGGTPVVPPTNWPEPETPEPPELPEPGDPVVEPPEPYEPSNGPTFIWNITNTSEPSDTSDLLEWIKKIFYELKAIHSDLKTWFENLGDAISDGFEAMDNACGQIYDAITENTDELKNQFQSLKLYLKQLFQWLGDKMNFQASGYDDTSVIYWLKRIWSKLGNGDINVRPTDPTTDPTGVWDWLIKLIQNFLIGLASSANDLISEMADLVSQVMHQFPFSIPWDIAAFLSAFAAAPITPDVDVTIPAIEGWWGETVISIDMSPYDTAAAAVRAMEKILFAAFLAWKSKDLLEFMDVTKWFNG